jgi:hypothetical protein
MATTSILPTNSLEEFRIQFNNLVSDVSSISAADTVNGYTFPAADGTSGQVIQTDGSGTLSFTTASANTPTSADGQALGSAALEWSDLYLADGGIIYLGNDQEITLTHVADTGLNLKHAATADDKYPTLTLQTGDTDIAVSDKLGVINFQAPDETTGTDAILVAAGIEAVSEGDFSSSNNATKLSFKTAASAAAAETASLSSTGVFTATSFSGSGAGLTAGTTPITTLDIDGATDIGDAVVDADLFIIDDGAGGTNRKTAASRIKTYIGGGVGYFLGGAGGARGDTTNGLEDIFRVNSATADTSCTIASSTNASATGPLTVSSGVTVTVNGVLAII